MEDLTLQGLYVIHAGNENYPLGKNIHTVAAASLLQNVSLF
jgi:hypothetical protein